MLIYRHRDKDEDFLGLKLMGYYFLGAFRFNLNEFAIPLGFLIYLVAFYPKTNVQIKRNSALLGLLILIVGVAVPRYNDYAFTRPIEVVADSINLYEHSLDEDWTIIRKLLKLTRVKLMILRYILKEMERLGYCDIRLLKRKTEDQSIIISN